MMKSLPFILFMTCIFALTGLFYARMSPAGYQTRSAIWFQGMGDLSGEESLITGDDFTAGLDTPPLDIKAQTRGRIITLTAIFTQPDSHAYDIAAAYLDYRKNALAGGTTASPVQTLSLAQAQQDVMQAQMALREAQLTAQKPLTPIRIVTPSAADWQGEIDRQNHRFAQQQFEQTGRLDGVTPDSLSPLYHSLTAQLVTLNSELAGLRVTYGNRHPDIIRLNRQIHSVQSHLKQESRTILQRMAGTLPQEEAENTTIIQAEQPSAPTQDIPALQEALAAAMQRLQQAENRPQALTILPQASLIDQNPDTRPAPVHAYWHNSAIAAAIGFALSVLLVLLGGLYRLRVHSPATLEEVTALPVYSMIPSARRRKKEGLLDHLLVNSNHALAESLRHVRTQMRLRHKGLETPRVVAVTSALPGDGKTSFAAMLATICAQCGDRVLVIDGDLRRPCVDKAFHVDKKNGLVDVLTGRVELSDAIQKTHETGVHLLTARATPSHALALIDSAKFWQCLRELRGDYDLVLLDTPSLLNFSDALILSGQADLTLLAVRQGLSSRRLKQAVDLLKPVANNPVATILTRVRGGSHRKLGGYADYTKKK